MEELPKIPPLLRKTLEGRDVYPINLVVNQRKFEEIHMDPHCFEGEQKSYITPELIYYFAYKIRPQPYPIYSRRLSRWLRILCRRNIFLRK